MKPFNEHNPKTNLTVKPGDWLMHGDVILYCEDTIAAEFNDMTKVKDDCLAYGELTGHLHKIIGDESAFELRECPKTKVRHLRVVEPVMLKHQEHSPIEVPPGNYRVGIQREYDPFSKRIRQVVD